MGKFLAGMAVLVGLAMILLVGWDGAVALAVAALLSWLALFLIRKYTDEKDFLTKVFVAALLARLVLGLVVHVFDLREFFGGDANTYHLYGGRLADYWMGQTNLMNDARFRLSISPQFPGWGMTYLVGTLYFIFGKNIYLAQTFCAVFGAATAGLVYFCSREIFENKRVSKISALLVALFPAFIIWSGQLLKDGLIVFLLVLSMTMVLELQKRFNYAAVMVLLTSMFGIITLRFYIFYIVAAAVAGSLLVGTSNTTGGILRRTIAVAVIGLGLTYFGVGRIAQMNVEQFGDLDRVQASRGDLERSAGSGFGADVDVSTTEGAISAVPIGLTYLMLAPFPWQMQSLRSAFTLPEVLVWWAMLPVMVFGLWYTAKNRLRAAMPIMIFSLMLTLAYSIFQGNVGTAYRQRTQIQVFLFIFIAVGWTLLKERRENRKLMMRQREREFAQRMRARG